MIVLSEAEPHEPVTSASARDNIGMTEAARIAGCRNYSIPKDFSQCENAENALWHIPDQDHPTPAVWSGFIPSLERYDAVYGELARKNIFLLNDPDQHRIALEFDRAFPLLGELTPRSAIVEQVAEAMASGETLGYPLFVRGAARSRKAAGWIACVANDASELCRLVEEMLALPYRSRGRVILRQLAPLRYSRLSDEGFRLGREYRVFLYGERLLGYGYYWEGDDPLRALSPAEERTMLAQATEASRRVKVPFVSVDIGQVESGDWIVIEIGDAQFAGPSQTPLIPLWIETKRIEDTWRRESP